MTIDAKDLATSSKLEKLKYYARENGVLHAIAAGVGRKSFTFWSYIGPLLTKKAYLRYHNSPPGDSDHAMLNLGSGSNRLPGAFNVDMDPRADAYIDVTKPLPLPNEVFKWIYCEEVIEHVDEERGLALLRECYRVLRVGGRIRLTTPDLFYFCEHTVSSDPFGLGINGVFYGHGHRFIYSKPKIESALAAVGFTDIVFSEYQDAASPLGPLDSHADRFQHPPQEALYVEASRL